MTRTRRALLMLACAMLPLNVLAQQPLQENSDGGRRSGTYLKTGLAHWQGDIFSRGSLTQWDVDLFGAEYNLTSVNVEVETYFRDTFLQLSGFSIGYRKDAVRHIDSGHMFSGKLFRDIDIKAVALKAGGGIEWGMPSLNFDQTEFEFASNGTVRYRHTHPDRNADVPFVGTTTDGAMYPFVELSVAQRPGFFLIEAGMRINIIGFQFDDYEVSVAEKVTHVPSKKRVLVPYLFMNLGLRMF
jgi:hypothetical protein